jgi:hypothetical protein
MSANIRPDQSFQAAAFNGFIHGLKGVWRDELYSNVVAEARETGANDVPELERAMAGAMGRI